MKSHSWEPYNPSPNRQYELEVGDDGNLSRGTISTRSTGSGLCAATAASATTGEATIATITTGYGSCSTRSTAAARAAHIASSTRCPGSARCSDSLTSRCATTGYIGEAFTTRSTRNNSSSCAGSAGSTSTATPCAKYGRTSV